LAQEELEAAEEKSDSQVVQIKPWMRGAAR
jgi:hypothetical protein